MNDGNCILPFRADKWTLLHRGRYGGDDVVGTMRLGLSHIVALLLMLHGDDAVVAE